VVSCISEGNHDTRENTYFAGQWQTLLQHNLVSYSHCHERELNTLTIRLHYRDYQTYRGFFWRGDVLDRYRKKVNSETLGRGIVAQKPG